MKKLVLKSQFVFVLVVIVGGFWLFSRRSSPAATLNFHAFGSAGVG